MSHGFCTPVYLPPELPETVERRYGSLLQNTHKIYYIARTKVRCKGSHIWVCLIEAKWRIYASVKYAIIGSDNGLR